MSYIPSRGYRDNWRSKVSEEKDLQEDLDMMVTTRVHRYDQYWPLIGRGRSRDPLKVSDWSSGTAASTPPRPGR